MKSASPTNYSSLDNVIEVAVVGGENHHQEHYSPPPSPSSGSAITPRRNVSASIISLIDKDSSVTAVKEVEEKLKTFNQTLAMLDNILECEGFDAILSEMLESITLKKKTSKNKFFSQQV